MDFEMVSQVLGGIGLFLIGMVLTTDGVREAAGDSLRSVLTKFTVRPFQAMLSGAGITALVQSSSATTIATISFVSAGLLTFYQALGLILGANIGTTATGWIVALLGLKFSVSMVALPLVGVGALMRLFMGGRTKDIGLALAGFGVMFVGLDVLQAGMGGLSDFITPETLPSDTWAGRAGLVVIGFGLTAVMQSSSAALAITLTALDAEGISMMQAAAMAIGANVGTTTTAGLAILGSGTAARRVAFAHVLFNALTGVVAFGSLPLLVDLITTLNPANETLALAAFHTIFNLVGVVMIAPFLKPFSRFVENTIPERGPQLTRRLDPSLQNHGGPAIEAVRATVLEIARETIEATYELIVEGRPEPLNEISEELVKAVTVTHEFVSGVRNLDTVGKGAQKRHVDAIHALDYLDQLVHLVTNPHFPRRHDDHVDELTVYETTCEALSLSRAWLQNPSADEVAGTRDLLEAIWSRSAKERTDFRRHVLDESALGRYGSFEANRDIEYARQLDELTYHLFRFINRMDRGPGTE